MTEGVVAINRKHRVMNLNKAAASLLQVAPKQALGVPFDQIIKIPRLQQLINRAFETEEHIEEEADY